MRLKLLGPLELDVDGRLVELGGPRQRVVLSMLALNANRVTSVDQLIDAVWDTSPPPTARTQVHTCISALRRVVSDAGQTVIRTYPPGYLLELSASELDSDEFTRTVAAARVQADEGRPAEAATMLRAALALWRGPALVGIDSELVRRGAAVLEEARLSAIEDRMRLDLMLGRNDISGELAALVAEHPLRERLYGYLMLALYRSGRQAEALDVRRRARAVLVEELGIEPGQELQDLERAILTKDSTLDSPLAATWPTASIAPHVEERPVVEQPMAPRQLPSSIADFTGRETHIATIRSALAGLPGSPADPYAVRIVAISGRGGVGKSSLAVRAAHELVDLFPDGHVYGVVGGLESVDRIGALTSRFLRALGVSGSAIPQDAQERAEMYRSMLAGRRMLVVLDDVRSEDEVRPLLPGSPGCAVIVTSRVRLSGLWGAAHVDVDVLDAERSVDLLARIVGPERVENERRAAVELAELCGGLPLALRIAGARLASRPHWRITDLVRRLADEKRRLDEFSHRGLELRPTIALTYRALDPLTQRLLRLIALVRGPDFPGWTAAALLDADGLDAADVLETLIDARMIDTVEYPGEQVRYRMHDLVRVFALEELEEHETPVEREAALRRVLGAWLDLACEAHRREYGGDFTVLHSDAERWREPSGAPATTFDNAIGWWDGERNALVAAIRQAAAAGLDDLCWDLALTSVTLFEVKGYFDLWRETADLGLRVTERAGNKRGKAAMLYSCGTLEMFEKRLDGAQQSLENALALFDEVDDDHGRGLVLRNLALVDALHGDSAGMLARYDQAMALMRAVGDRMGEAQILRSLASFWVDEGETERARGMLDASLEICRDVGCLRGEAQVVYQVAHLHLAVDDIEHAREALHRVLLLVRDNGDRIGETYALYSLGVVRYREGRAANADTTFQHALALARRVGEKLIEGKSLYMLGLLRNVDGDAGAATALLAEARHVFAAAGSVLWEAKALIALAEAAPTGAGVSSMLDEAEALLRAVDSQEAVRRLADIESARATVGRGGASG